MVNGVSRTEILDQDFNEENFGAFVQQTGANLSDAQIDTTFENLVADGNITFPEVFDTLDANGDGKVTSQEVIAGCGTCQGEHSADGVSADGTSGSTLADQMDNISGEGSALSADIKDEIMDEDNPDNIFGDDISDPDRAYLQEINIFGGVGEYDDEAKEAFRLIVDMYVNDADFRDLIQYYVDTMGVGPTITMGELEGSNGSTLFGIGSINDTKSVIDITNITADPERAQETIAHELMHNLGEGHETADEEDSFDAELDLMNDMDVAGTSRSSGYPWSGYSTSEYKEENPLPQTTESE